MRKKQTRVTEASLAALRRSTSDGAAQSRRRIAQIEHERSEAEKLTAAGYEVFAPITVCDRVAIKDGKVFFVEFKKRGQVLRAGQQKVFDLMPGNYLIVYADTK